MKSIEISDTDIPLYVKFPKLKKIPRVNLMNGETSLEKLENCSDVFEKKQIWVKHDDLTTQIYGGNKPRKLEFVFGDANRKKKTHILTVGAIGTNHGLATAALTNSIGMESSLYLIPQPLNTYVRENLLSDVAYGANLHLCRSQNDIALKLGWKWLTDRKSYFLYTGGSTPIGCLGFVNAALELETQIIKGFMPEPDRIYVPCGSAGTVAGLALGLCFTKLKSKLIGIGVTELNLSGFKKVYRLAEKTLKLMQKYDSNIPDVFEALSKKFEVDHSYIGKGYGSKTPECLEAITIMEKDNLHLDPVYTGKAVAGLIDHCRKDDGANNEIILYWHTKNSIDQSPKFSSINYTQLPKTFHKYFDGSITMDS